MLALIGYLLVGATIEGFLQLACSCSDRGMLALIGDLLVGAAIEGCLH